MIWDACDGARHIQEISGRLYRLAESQEQIATRRMVDTLEEQAILEDLLEASKPEYTSYAHLDYLLRTPFRYPPLEHGSRFGLPHEPSLFYGAETITTTLAEVAYYRLLFFHDMSSLPAPLLNSEHTIFSISYSTKNGIKLQDLPFSDYADRLMSATHYGDTQRLGTDMRDNGIQGFQYQSARDPLKGICVGLFTPEPFQATKPDNQTAWFCEVDSNHVSFKEMKGSELFTFEIQQFQVDGCLPKPA